MNRTNIKQNKTTKTEYRTILDDDKYFTAQKFRKQINMEKQLCL